MFSNPLIPASSSAFPSKQVAITYVVFLACAALVYFTIAQREFASIQTMAALSQCLAMFFLSMQALTGTDSRGISVLSLALHSCSFACRLSSTTWLNGYLPVDPTGDWFYQLMDVLMLLMCLQLLHTILKKYKHTYQSDCDDLDVKPLLLLCVLCAVFVHPDLNDWATFDIAWTISLYLDTVSMLPQLLMSTKIGKVPSYTAHYLAATLASRAFSAWFWYYGAENIARHYEGGFCFGAAAIIVAHLLQFLLLADFGYYYIRAGFSGSLCGSGKGDYMDLNALSSCSTYEI